MIQPTSDSDPVRAGLEYIAAHADAQPGLDEVAAAVGLSPHHLQRLFRRQAGLSPKKFLQYLTVERAKRALDQSASVLDAAYEAGLSGPGRLHDLFVALEAATPGEYKARGAGMTFRQGVAEGPFGPTLLVWNDRGLAGLAFLTEIERGPALADVARPWSQARLVADDSGAAAMIDRVFAPLDGRPIDQLRLLVAGTDFQVKVWEALLRIPLGALVTYEALGRAVGKRGAARAVGNAVGANPVSWLIPCHRVIRRTAVIGHYRWGSPVKRLLIGAEASLVASA
ncbi:MAG: methylated-DNA--[protein]-cysteine S-methyltransferase [Elsteraceae bacterium]